jgi:hypothetical protein
LAPITGFLVLDRLRKRCAPPARRDDLDERHENVLGRAFGIHRALDTVGAHSGRSLRSSCSRRSAQLQVIFLVSACICYRTRDPHPVRPQPGARRTGERATRLRHATPGFSAGVTSLVVIAGSALGLMTISDGFQYLVLSAVPASTRMVRCSISAPFFYLALALPFGGLSTRSAARASSSAATSCRSSCVLLLSSSPGCVVLTCLRLLGAYYAATDGVSWRSPAWQSGASARAASRSSPLRRLASSLGSILFGAIWAASGPGRR